MEPGDFIRATLRNEFRMRLLIRFDLSEFQTPFQFLDEFRFSNSLTALVKKVSCSIFFNDLADREARWQRNCR
jgi:hypothetical protein